MQLIYKLCIFRLIHTNGRDSHIAEFEGLSHFLSMLCADSLFELEIIIFDLKLLHIFRVLKRILQYAMNKRHYKRVKVRYLGEYANGHYRYLIDFEQFFRKCEVYVYSCKVHLAQEKI